MARADAATAWDLPFSSIEGATLDFADQRGRVLLVVDTASFCGFTYQTGLWRSCPPTSRRAG